MGPPPNCCESWEVGLAGNGQSEMGLLRGTAKGSRLPSQGRLCLLPALGEEPSPTWGAILVPGQTAYLGHHLDQSLHVLEDGSLELPEEQQ